MSALTPILPPALRAAEAAPPDPAWQAAAALFAKRHWADAEKAFAAYARRFPPPPRRAEALAMAGQARLALKDSAGARRHFEAVVREPALLRSEPEAVATAFDALHRLLLGEGRPASQRQRLLADFQRSLPAAPLLARAREREADALLAAGQAREALGSYRAAAGLSPAGTNIAALLEGSLAPAPAALSSHDLKLLLAAGRARPPVAAGLAALLAPRREGWQAEDIHARLLLETGQAEAAIAIWRRLLRSRRGPADSLSLACAEALAGAGSPDAPAAYREWMKTYPQSSLHERAAAQQALLLAGGGRPAEALPALEAFLERYPQSRFAPEVDKALARTRAASARIATLEAAREARESERRNDPALASLERAEALLARKRYDLALKEFAAFRNLRRHPLWGRAWYGLGQTRQALGETGKALEAWAEIQRRAAGNTNIAMAAEAWRAAGDACLEDLADPARALSAYRSALQLKPALADGAFDLNRGLALLMQGEAAQAAALFAGRRDAAGADRVEFLRWDNLVRQCAAGLAPPPAGVPPALRRARADLAMAEALSAGGSFARALRHYLRAQRPLASQAGEDQCALGMARAYAALGQSREALEIFGRFKERLGRSPLAPEALLRAGVLSASPRVSNFRQAREWFALAASSHPGTPEGEAAQFYDATLAWRGRRWAEARQLFQAFIAGRPDSPLAQTALARILPLVESKRLAAPLEADGHGNNIVTVFPGARKRAAYQLVAPDGYSIFLEVRGSLPFRETHIEDIDPRGGTILWTGPMIESSTVHRYYLSSAYSSKEYVMVRGTFDLPPGGGGEGRGLDPFRVTVPSVDVDWVGFGKHDDEFDEEERHVVVPLNTNRLDDLRHILLWDPYDDDERNGRPAFPRPAPVNPDITLDWDAREAFLLVDSRGAPHSRTIAATGADFKSKDIAGAFGYTLDPIYTTPVPKLSFKIYAEGQNTESGKAIDTIHGRLVLVDIDIDANRDGEIDGLDEPLEMDPGGYACVCTNSLTPIKLTLQPAGLPGKLTLSATMGGQRIRVWQNANRTSQINLSQRGNVVPGTLYVEGVAPSAALRDVELRLEYDENPPNHDNPLFKCEDRVRLTVLSVDFLDASKSPVSTLKVGKWENAFNAGPTVKNNFIDLDPDRFHVRVNDQSKKGAGKVSVKLSTDSDGTAYDDDATEIELNEEPANSGIFISTNMLMVSDDVDDDFSNASVVADDTKNDRTHKIALGGKVKVQYPETGTVICEKEASVPPSLKTVDVNIIILRDKPAATGGVPVIAVATVSNFWKIAKDRYAQVGVDIQWTGPTVEDPPAGVDLSDWLQVLDTPTSTVLSAEAKTLISALGTTNTTADTHVFYVNRIAVGSGFAGGLAVADYYFDESDDPFTYNVFINNSTLSPWGGYAAAHELTHLTTDAGHPTTDTWRLMHGAVLTTTGATGSRRLTASEETTIRGNSHVH